MNLLRTDYLAGNPTGALFGNGAYINSSDRRLKEDIRAAHEGLAIVRRMEPRSFKRIGAFEPRTELGFVADELQEILPEAIVRMEMEGESILGISESMIIPVLVNAIKELAARVASLEAVG
jgi:hypothetical protein